MRSLRDSIERGGEQGRPSGRPGLERADEAVRNSTSRFVVARQWHDDVQERPARRTRGVDQVLCGAPGTIRTCDARFRKPTLYPLSYGGWADANRHCRAHLVTSVSFWPADLA